MLINRTVTKKILETIVHETFSQFGVNTSSCLLDSLKLLGFYYATNAGISINIEDLKTPYVKKQSIKKVNNEILTVSKLWQQGHVSNSERFQTIIDSWNLATETLKNRIVNYYETFDPANNLYIMAFSGARGNMSQVRQLVGMRGLMSDQEGKIIDLPIQANFREGLSSIDYIISSYGARKGIVDTALKTADSGYLTRRLIYLAQDLVIREENCQTTNGVIFLLKKNANVKNLIGRTLINAKRWGNSSSLPSFKNVLLTSSVLNDLKSQDLISLNVRSPLTCKSHASVCQRCYGWDLAHNKIISLGEAVGIIAAQSIGEPGTQLTMRTFHTGGIFTSESVKQILAPFSGKIVLPNLNTISYRTNQGLTVLQLQQEGKISITNWQGIKEDITLEIGAYLHITESCFIKKGDVIAEYSTQSSLSNKKRLKPIYTSFAGEIRYENVFLRKMPKETKRTLSLTTEDHRGVIWIASGKIFSLPKETHYKFVPALDKNKAFATLKLISPYSGIVSVKKSSLQIVSLEKIINIDLESLIKNLKHCKVKYCPIVKNYQAIDNYTVLGFLEIFPQENGLIYSVRKKETKYVNIYFLITESDVWKINSDQLNDFHFLKEKKTLIVRSGELMNTTSRFSNSGYFLKKDGLKMIFQNATPISLPPQTIVNYKHGDFVLEKEVFASLVIYSQQTEDIVQGLPKIDELIEARSSKTKAVLAVRPGIIFNSSKNDKDDPKTSSSLTRMFFDDIISCNHYVPKEKYKKDQKEDKIKEKEIGVSKRKKKQEKIILNISHSFSFNDSMVIYNNCLFKLYSFSSLLELDLFTRKKKHPISFYGRGAKLQWKKTLINNEQFTNKNDGSLKNREILNWKQLASSPVSGPIKNIRNDFIIAISDKKLLFFEYSNPIREYELPLSAKIIVKPGTFIDIGEPITEGVIDVHELLAILFRYHLTLDGIFMGTIRSLHKFQLILVNSIQSIYQSQGVNISSKHIEIIVKQMTAKVIIRQSGDTPLFSGELVRLSLINEIYEAFKASDFSNKQKLPHYEPVLLSAINSSLSKPGFLAAAGFQETKRVLSKAAVEGSSDWLRGLKECIIIGRLIPAGSAFLNYKQYLDNIYMYKNLYSDKLELL